MAPPTEKTTDKISGDTLEHVEVVTTPPIPGALNTIIAPPEATREQSLTVRSEARLNLEYISSAGPRIITQFTSPSGMRRGAGVHAKPINIDELEQDLGTDVYLRMLTDAKVKSGDAKLRTSILSKPLQITSACDEHAEKDQKKRKFAQEVADFVQANIDEVKPGFTQVSYEMLEGIALGYKLLEQVYDVREIIPGNGPQTCLFSLNPKPQEAVSIITDQYNFTLGYVPRIPDSGLFGSYFFGELGIRTLEDDNNLDIPGLIPPEKVVCFTWMPRNDDPRGTSHLRAAFVPWRLKIGLYPAYEAYMARFAQPSAALELGGVDVPPIAGADGVLIKDPVALYDTLLAHLRNFAAGGAIVAPAGVLKLLQATGNGEAYLKAFELVDSQITDSILFANLATEGGKYGTQALGEVHQDTQGLLINYAKEVYAHTVREQIVKPLVKYNYGDKGLQVLPLVTFGDTEQQDFATTAGGIASLKGVEMIFPHQYNEILTDLLGLPPLPQKVIDLLIEGWEAQQEAQQQLLLDPTGQGAPQDPNDPNAPMGPGQQPPGQPPADPNAPPQQDTSLW